MTATDAPIRARSMGSPIDIGAPAPLVSLRRPWWATRWAVPLVAMATAPTAAFVLETHPLPAALALSVAVPGVLAASRLSATVTRERLTGAALAALAASSAPMLPPLLGYPLAAVGGVAAGLPWLPRSERRRERRRRREIEAAWPAVVAEAGLPPRTALTGCEATSTGWRLRVRTPRGTPADVIETAARRLASALGRGTVRVKVDKTDAGRATIDVDERDPLGSKPIPRPAVAVATVANGAPFGIDANGRTVALPLIESSGLVGGRPGAGKSVGLSLVAAAAVEAGDAELWAIDLKRGVELAPWLPACTHAATTGEAAAALLGALEALMTDRLDDLAERGARKVTPTSTTPLVVLLVDELAELDKAAFATLRRILSLGRAAGISVWAATQRPSADLIPTAVRALFRLAVAYPVRRRTDSDVILGSGSAGEGADASKLAAPGLCWLVDDGAPRRLRSYLLDDAAIGRIVAGSAHTRTEPATGTERTDARTGTRNRAEHSGTRPVTHDARLDGHPAWRAMGGYAVAIHRHLRTTTDTAAGAARAVGCSDRHARSCLAALSTAHLARRVGTQWEALPAALDALEAAEGLR